MAPLTSSLCADDIRFPELCRQLAWGSGAQVLLHPAAFIRDTAFHSWHAFATTRALENQVHFFSLSFAGERWGGSILAPPWLDSSRGAGWEPEVLGQEESVLLLRLDPADEMGAAAVAAQARREVSFRADAFFPPPEDPARERGLRRRVLEEGAGAAVRSESAAGQVRDGSGAAERAEAALCDNAELSAQREELRARMLTEARGSM